MPRAHPPTAMTRLHSSGSEQIGVSIIDDQQHNRTKREVKVENYTWFAQAMTFTRRIIGFADEREYSGAVSVCRMLNYAIAGQPLPKHRSADHALLFCFLRGLASLRVLEIDKVLVLHANQRKGDVVNAPVIFQLP